jgi:acyl-CoA hydrolase
MPMGLSLNKEIAMTETLETYHMIMPKDLNPRGTLFAGSCANFMIEGGFLTAEAFLGHPHMVFFGMNGMKFVKSVGKGETVSVTGTVIDAGRTSLGIFVTVRFLHTKELGMCQHFLGRPI